MAEPQKFVLVGPHAGKTMDVNGHAFENGEFTFVGSPDQIAFLARSLSYYGAVPAQQAELDALKAAASAAPDAPAAPAAADDAMLAQALGMSLGEAIGTLDPENDAHWTSNNLPALEPLADLIGKKVSRGDVDAVADGYTRAKARAAKQ